MVDVKQLLLKLVAEMSSSEFIKACEKAGFSTVETQIVLDTLFESGE